MHFKVMLWLVFAPLIILVLTFELESQSEVLIKTLDTNEMIFGKIEFFQQFIFCYILICASEI